MNLKEITVGTKLLRREQRAIDYFIEKLILKRDVFHRDLRSLRPKPMGKVSFIDDQTFEKYGHKYSEYEARITPYYTRAIEPVDHYLIPKMNELGLTVVVTHHPQFKQVNVYAGQDKALATVVHESITLAISTACLSAIAPNLDEQVINQLATKIKK